MKNLQNIFFILTVLVILNACKYDEITVTRDTENFDTLIIRNAFEIELVQDSLNKIEITGIEKFASKVSAITRNNTLTIDLKANDVWLYPHQNKIKIALHIKNLSLVNFFSTSKLVSYDTIRGTTLGIIYTERFAETNLILNYDRFYYWNNKPRAGILTLRGKTNYLAIWNFSMSNVFAQNCQSKYVEVENHAIGSCYLNAAESITYSIFSQGNIVLYGNPAVINPKVLQSTGKLIISN